MTRATCALALLLGVSAWSCGDGRPGESSTRSTPETGGATPEAAPRQDAEAPPGDDAEATQGHEEAAVDPAEAAPGLPWNDPSAMAVEALGRCKGRDLAALRQVSSAVNRAHQIELAAGQSLCEAIFGERSWRAQAVAAWSGGTQPFRVTLDEARVPFHQISEEEIAVVVLRREADRWRFHDIASHPRERFSLWGAEP